MTLPLLVTGLTKGYRRRPVLADLALELHPGEAVALLGANGAGKSTLLGCLVGDRLPDRGEVRVCGADPFSDPRAAARCTGWVPERPFLYEELAAGEMVEFVAAARGLAPGAARGEAERLFTLLGLAGAEGALCGELSQGMGRKLALVCALLHRPHLVLLDEAMNGLDEPSAAAVEAELDARRAEGAAVLLASHDLRFVARWCERALFLLPGGAWRSLRGKTWEEWRTQPALHLPDILS